MKEAVISGFDVSVDPTIAAWEALVAGHPYGHLLQTAPWGEFKAQWGWQPRRFTVGCDAGRGIAAQVLFRRLPLG
ncbi:MAG TPA: hypothetical protein DEP84_09985, partial [Chloroflexi bacterium]|nr:hypothetical protein [Chloroflexota bacterium]